MFKPLTLTLAGLATLTFAASPASAQYYSHHAQPYHHGSSSNGGDQLAGALIGGTVGAVIGESIAGRGNRTEGAIAGALIGGTLGASVADNRRSYGYSQPYHYRTHHYRSPYYSRGYGHSRHHHYGSPYRYRSPSYYRHTPRSYYTPYRRGSGVTIHIGNGGGYYGHGHRRYRPHRRRHHGYYRGY